VAYRPQFAFPRAPQPCEDQRCTYSFDGSNTPALVGTLGAGLNLSKIPLLMDTDAPFMLRGLCVPNTALQFRLEDANENPLSDCNNQLQGTNFQFPALYSETDGAGLVTLDGDNWGVHLPAGSAMLLYVFNPTAGDVDLGTLFINLHGVKRYQGASCA
jgi:hypothetical protein